MKPQSAKAKGRNLQKYVCSRILSMFSGLHPDDCTSRSMGAGGEDILLSPLARRLLPISIECKNRASFAIYKDYEQAKANAKTYEPVLIIKSNRQKPLIVVELDHYLSLWQRLHQGDTYEG